MEILASIQDKLDEFSKVEKRIGQFVLQNPQNVIRMSISELAQQTGAKSEASIVKFYRRLGYSGYHDFKVTLATEIAGQNFYKPDTDIQISQNDDVASIRKKIFLSSVDVLELNNRTIDDKALERAVTIMSNAKRIIIIGYGTSASMAYDLFVKLIRIGIDCYYTTDAHTNALILSEPREGDVLFAISFSGESKDVVLQAKQVKGKVPIIALTGEEASPLSKNSDVCITVKSYETTYHTDAMLGRIVQLAVINVLFTAIAVRGGDKALSRLNHSRQGLSFLKF